MGKLSSPREREKLGLLLRELREEKKMTQTQVADVLGVHQTYVSKYESGERRLDILELRAVCKALGTSLLTCARRLDRILP